MMRSVDRPCSCRQRRLVSLVFPDGAKSVDCPVDGCSKKIELVKKKKAKKEETPETAENS